LGLVTAPLLTPPITERILNEAGRMLGSVLADLVNLLNPSALILGGELGTAGAPLVQGVEASLRRYAQPATAAALQVLTAALGMRAELTGALQMAASMAAR
jgi:predicted NBD/HSP70 family sugar kinase